MRSWYMTAKPDSICAKCDYYEKNCTLKCRPSDMQGKYNLVFLFEMPEATAAAHSLLMGPEVSTVCTKISDSLKRKYSIDINYSLLYSVCSNTRKAPVKSLIDSCAPIMRRRLLDLSARYSTQAGFSNKNVILAFGAGAVASLGLKASKLKEHLRGKGVPITLDGVSWTVIPTVSMREIYNNPNLTSVVLADADTMWSIVKEDFRPDTLDEISAEYTYPTSIAEVRDLVEYIINYTDPTKQSDPSKWPIALDTETTGLNPLAPGMRTLCISAAWDDYKSCAIAYNHKDAPYSVDEVRPYIERLIKCNKPTIWHNGKYDYMWLKAVDGMEVSNMWWDTMCAEHYLQESNQGYYGLKNLAKSYYRRYTGYEGELKSKIADELGRRDAAHKANGLVEYVDANERGVLFDTREMHELEASVVDATLTLALMEASDDGHAELKRHRTRSWAKVKKAYLKQGEDPPQIPRLKKTTKSTTNRTTDGLYEIAPLSLLLKYAAVDTDLCRLICKEQRRIAKESDEHSLSDLSYLMRSLYIPGTYALGRMSLRGLPVDKIKASEFSKEMSAASSISKSTISSLICNPEFNANSPKQKLSTLQDVFNVDISKLPKTKSGAPSVDKNVLAHLTSKHANTPLGFFAHALNSYTSIKSTNTLVEKTFLKCSEQTGRIHTKFNLAGTKTGRLSSSNPAFQNIATIAAATTILDNKGGVIASTDGWAIKDLIVCEKPSTDIIYDLDIKAAEIRVLCAYLELLGGDPLIDAVRAGRDIPSYVCTLLFGAKVWQQYSLHETWIRGITSDPMKLRTLREDARDLPTSFYDVDTVYNFVNREKGSIKDIKDKRTAGKRGLYGTIYGGGPYTIATTIFGVLSDVPDIRKMQLDYGREIQEALFTEFPGIRKYVKGTIAHANRHKWVRSMFGRRRRFPFLVRGAPKQSRKSAEREAVNFCIQSTSTDLVLAMLIRIEKSIHKINGDVRLSVHDSVMGIIKRGSVHLMREFFNEKIVEDIRRLHPWLPVDFVYDLEVGNSYYDLVPYRVLEKGSYKNLSFYDAVQLKKLGKEVYGKCYTH